MKLNRLSCMILSLLLLETQLQAQTMSDVGARKNADAPTITITNLDVNDTILKLSYQIKNVSYNDIWICEYMNYFPRFEVYMAKDEYTLLIRRRLDVPMIGSGAHPYGRYARMLSGESRTESLLLPLPVRPWRVLSGSGQHKGIEYAKRLLIELGYFPGDFPSRIIGMLEEAEKNPQIKHEDRIGYPTDVIGWLASSVDFNTINESVQDRDELVVIPWTNQMLKGEQVLRTIIKDINIPYEEKVEPIRYTQPNLSLCNRIEIQYQPSMLEYFFPHATQQDLLNQEEKKYLQSQEQIIVHDQNLIKLFTDEISKGYYGGYLFSKNTVANVVCYNDDEHLTSFNIYDDIFIETKEMKSFLYRRDFQSIKILTPQIQPFELRIHCATNLRNLWYRLRLYHKAKQMRFSASRNIIEVADTIPMAYPNLKDWCDGLVQSYHMIGPEAWIMKMHKCPSAGEGECHYAMNPNCEPNSPSDTVLLFETKAGWNQHGGPELFTFDNHDPKGGCVLLNDGTVKFIRTEDELKNLRWKKNLP